MVNPAKFIACSDLVDFRETKQMVLTWDIEGDPAQFARIEIYRYIGYLDICTKKDEVEISDAKLICSVCRESDDEVKIISFFPSESYEIMQDTNLVDMNKLFVDDFSKLNNSSADLRLFHEFVEPTSNKKMIEDISFGKRVIYYFIKTFEREVPPESTTLPPPPPPPGVCVQWVRTSQRDDIIRQKARDTEKPYLVLFCDDDCPNCRNVNGIYRHRDSVCNTFKYWAGSNGIGLVYVKRLDYTKSIWEDPGLRAKYSTPFGVQFPYIAVYGLYSTEVRGVPTMSLGKLAGCTIRSNNMGVAILNPKNGRTVETKNFANNHTGFTNLFRELGYSNI